MVLRVFSVQFFIVLLLCFACSFESFAQNRCQDIFKSSESNSLETGFINPFLISEKVKFEQENFSAPHPSPVKKNSSLQRRLEQSSQRVQSYFRGNIENGLVEKEIWISDFKKGSSDSLKALELITHLGKRKISKNFIHEGYLEVFKEILKLSKEDLIQLPKVHLIKLYGLFSYWNILPPQKWSESFLKALEKSSELWSEKDVSDFSLFRRLTPLDLGMSFKSYYLSKMIKEFSSYSLQTKMIVLGTELIHGSYFTVRQLGSMFESLNESFSKHKGSPLRMMDLKDLYRGVMVMKSLEPTLFSESVAKIIVNIEFHLKENGVSLSEGGVSGFSNKQRKKDPYLVRLEEAIDGYLKEDYKVYEYMDGLKPGFFDPVDIYYPNQRLIVEWDGAHHYFKPMSIEGHLKSELKDLVLRPYDQGKDRALKMAGYRVIRFSRQRNYELNNLDVESLILEQNN